MATERIQRRIDAFLDEADAAATSGEWAAVAEKARAVLAIDGENEDARAFLRMAEANRVTPSASGGPSPAGADGSVATRILPASFAGGRYAVHGFLGEGGSKKVYLAHDTRLDRDVALAVVEGLDGDALERVRREAQSVARLGDHPNIVSVFDTGDDGDVLYTVYQYMAGGALADRIAAAPDHRLPFEDALRYAAQVCAALAFAHGKGVIHRDIKPANVFLDDDDTARLGDFGLAAASDRTRLTQHGTFLGTATYMAPEQAMGQPPDPRSDLYSLGCVLYEMITGRPPFVGDDTVAIVTQHLNTPPIAPTWHRPGVPPALEALVLALLEKDPAKRPQTAADVRISLTGVSITATVLPSPAQSGEQNPYPGVRAEPQDPIYRQTFVGREAELRQMQAAFDGALSGAGALVMVVGEPGIGKTSVCEQLATYAAMRGGRTLRGHCYEEGSLSLPYLPFVEALRTYVLDRDPEALRSELGSNAPYVARIVSEVRDKLAVEPPASGDPDDDRWRLLQGVATFLRNAANVQPLVIVLEDLHWADKGTLDVLTHMARGLEGARIVIIGTYRDVEVDRSHPLSSALAELRRSANFSRVTLRGLGAPDVQKMLANIAGRDVPWALAEQVHRQTEGNPLFVQEVLRYLVEEGFLQRNTSGELHRPNSEIALAMQIPEGLRDVIGKRLSRLSPETNRVLAVAAVVGRDFRLDVLQDVASVTEEELYAALEEASGKGVIEERRQQGALAYRFTHAFLRQTLYEEIFTPRRIRTHQQVARAMEARYASRVAEHAAELAEHFAQSTDGDDLAKAVHYGELAAERAMGVYAYAEAARLLEAALQAQEVLDPDDSSRRLGLLLAFCAALNPADQPARVCDELGLEALRLAEGLGDQARATQAVMLALDAVMRKGAAPAFFQPPGSTWLDHAQRVVEPGTREWVAIEAVLSLIEKLRGHLRSGWEHATRAWELAKALADPRAMVEAAGMGVLASDAFPENVEFRAAVASEVATYPARGVLPRTQVHANVWLCLLAAGDREGAERALVRMEELARTNPDPDHPRWLNLMRLQRAVLDGDLERAAEPQEEGDLPIRDMHQISAPLALLGRWGEALESAHATQRRGVFTGLARLALVLAQTGSGDEARSVLRAGFSRANEDAEWGVGEAAALLEAAILLGERDIARRLAGHLGPAVNVPVADLFGFSSVGRLLGDEALLRGAHDQGRAYYDQALAACRKIRFRPEIALNRLRLAQVIFDHYPAERDAAIEHLDFALGELLDMKMAPAIEEAMQLRLRVVGAAGSDPQSSIVLVSTAVQRERPNLLAQAAPDGSVTLMFTDIQDSTALTERHGDAKWLDILRVHNAAIEEQVRASGGRVVKNRGDGFMVAFAQPAPAVACALAIQAALAGHEVIRVRIGLHTGNPVQEGEDFFGTDVNFAARVADRALGGQVLVSARLYDQLAGERVARFGEPVEFELKGLAGAHRVYAVMRD